MDIMSEQMANPNRQIQTKREPNENSRIEIYCLEKKNHWMNNSRFQMPRDERAWRMTGNYLKWSTMLKMEINKRIEL